eukprot:2972103-Prymnesium_polylepis.1
MLPCVEPQDVHNDKATEVAAPSFSWCRIEEHALRDVTTVAPSLLVAATDSPALGCCRRGAFRGQKCPTGDAPDARTCADASPY